MEAYKVYWTNCVKGIHKGQMVLHLVEAIGKIPICIRMYDLLILCENFDL